MFSQMWELLKRVFTLELLKSLQVKTLNNNIKNYFELKITETSETLTTKKGVSSSVWQLSPIESEYFGIPIWNVYV